MAQEKVCFVGNLMIDSMRYHLERARNLPLLSELGLQGKRFGLLTLHRPSNVDDRAQLEGLLQAIRVISDDLPLYFPVHPRTRAHLVGLSLGDNIHLLDPLGYLDFLCLMAHSSAVFTDSGGIQEETTALQIPCVTLRDNTERPITVEEGSNRLAGTSCVGILDAWRDVKMDPKRGKIPQFWDGHAAERCLTAIRAACSVSSER